MPPAPSAARCGVFSASSFNASRCRYHRPSRPIPTGTISYRAGSIADITVSADRSEISCSPDRPPNKTPTLSRLLSAIRAAAPPMRELEELIVMKPAMGFILPSAWVTPAPGINRKVARSALLCSRSHRSGPPSRARLSINRVVDATNLTPNPFPRGKGDRKDSVGAAPPSYPPSPLSGTERGNQTTASSNKSHEF